MSADYEQLSTRPGRLLTIPLASGQLNAFTGKMLSELLDAMDRSHRDDDVRAGVFHRRRPHLLRGAGLSGGAIPSLPKPRPCDRGLDGHRDGGGLFTLRISIAEAHHRRRQRPCGRGRHLHAVAMDVRLASEAARYGFVFTRRAIVTEACSSWFLPRRSAPRAGAGIGDDEPVFPADEALEGRLVRRSISRTLLPRGALAREIADNPRRSRSRSTANDWKMLGADHPMEAHKVDSKGIYARGKSAEVRKA